jgi:hypothetical protein
MIHSLLAASLAMLTPPIDSNLPAFGARQDRESTIFQTGRTYADRINLRADVAVVYGIDKTMPARIKAWRDRGYRIHLMTGVAWGEYQDYLYGRWDGINHENEAQTRDNGEKIGHGGDVYYMSPGKNYGKYLAEGIRPALELGVEAVHLEEPEFWSWGGYGEGFKQEWQSYYNEPWQDPASSPDARWRAAKLMYFLYRRALQQVFDSIQDFNKAHKTHIRCYVPTHSLLNYADWGIVSPESSLARLNGCDGYIAQVWTGTAREENFYAGVKKERTFETAFLEYGSMQNLVRSTGRQVWYLADPIEDNPNHDWGDYRQNYHSTLVASLLQPDVSHYEVMPWPERIFNDNYPSEIDKTKRVPIPEGYATELQVLIQALKDMKQKSVRWESGTRGIGVLVSDSLMFQRSTPNQSDNDIGHFYGLAMPFVKRGMPVQPIQLENVTLPHYLDETKVLLMTYEGMKPLSPDVHDALANWVKRGGTLAFVDNDGDPYQKVREWWNTGSQSYATPREHLFEKLGLTKATAEGTHSVGRGRLIYLRQNPVDLSHRKDGADWLANQIRAAAPNVDWKESGAMILRRGPYIVAAGMDETSAPLPTLKGTFVDLFDPQLRLQTEVKVAPGSRHFLLDLAKCPRQVLATGMQVSNVKSTAHQWAASLEGISETTGILLLRIPGAPTSIRCDGKDLGSSPIYDAPRKLLWLQFPNSPRPQKLEINY